MTDANNILAVNAFIDVANAALENSTSFEAAAVEHNKLTERVIKSMRNCLLTSSAKKEEDKSRFGEIRVDTADKGYLTPQGENTFSKQRGGDEVSSYGLDDDFDTGASDYESFGRLRTAKVEMDIESLGTLESLQHQSQETFVNRGIELTKEFGIDAEKTVAKLATLIASLEHETRNLTWKLDESYQKLKKVNKVSQVNSGNLDEVDAR